MKSTCKRTRRKLISLLTQQLEEKDARTVAQHLARCPRCSTEAQGLRSAWKLMGEYHTDERFNDISGIVVQKVKNAEISETLIEKIINTVIRIPAPALCTIMAICALPAGIYLGENLHRALSTTDATFGKSPVAAETQELPLDIFDDVPEYSLGDIYANLANES